MELFWGQWLNERVGCQMMSLKTGHERLETTWQKRLHHAAAGVLESDIVEVVLGARGESRTRRPSTIKWVYWDTPAPSKSKLPSGWGKWAVPSISSLSQASEGQTWKRYGLDKLTCAQYHGAILYIESLLAKDSYSYTKTILLTDLKQPAKIFNSYLVKL